MSEKNDIVKLIDASNSVWDQFDRAVPSNPYNYTEIQLIKRENTLKAMARDYPTLPRKWLEWSFDTIDNKSEEDQQAIIDGAWDKLPRDKKPEYEGVAQTVEHLGTWSVTNEDPDLPYTITP